ncbi:MAG: GNAT family N-acetyltransferase [Actinomycetota bacterium]
MGQPHEEFRQGLDYLEAVTALLQRSRLSHPTEGSFEAAEIQWWWSRRRPTDELPQLFWFDDEGRPEAAAIMTTWGDAVGLDPLVLPGSDPAWLTTVMTRGLAHATDHGHHAIELEVVSTNRHLLDLLAAEGFAFAEDGLVEHWMAAEDRAPISPLHDEYRLSTRRETPDVVYHYDKRGGPDVEARLQQTSLYDPDLDLFIRRHDGEHAAHCLFWYDPVTETGVVEPLRTEDDHQRRGLARHLLTVGLDRLAAAGAKRLKICSEVDNPAARRLYEGIGFEPVTQTVVYARSDSNADRGTAD